MSTCTHCGEDPGKGARCASCGRIQYRYAVEEGTEDAVAATTARDDLRDGDATFEDLQELIAGMPTHETPAREQFRVHVPQEPSRVPDHARASLPTQQDPLARKPSGLASLISFAVFVAFGVIFFAAVSDSGSFRNVSIGQFIVPALIAFGIIRAVRNRSRRG